MAVLDQTDKHLLNLLQENARFTTKQLALKLNLSPTAIYERLKKLERQNYIDRYVALVNPKKIQKDFVTFVMIQLKEHTQASIAAFEREIALIPEIVACFHVSGTYDYLIKVNLDEMSSFRIFMVEKLTKIPHISNTQSAFSIKEVFNHTALKL
ncbi:Lrp/AsnC family transcriptional regulator [Psychroflexus sp. ALD_RP9]|uniref:Lrp/AsnC family transcriptional regulator n=1 Tax=Psychroflexus sp. ALD_RP9 TaxID=2777186 RepID=UPI001A8E3DBE|nr:Lrp/AsnC family transcriptional regulator [Psychroflexus sp. ALD_RP9]QSS96922.1 Lrp/AsnC family transcriptional regulator [Psychroflexus sp. ALD_RP9]